ncbi:MAG TPA: DUF4136 domain-containing protein [Myxococcota bacterium]|jgi:hypothetical protein
MLRRSLLGRLSLALAIPLALLGCASDGVDVSTTFDPLTPFPAQASYLWDDAANRLPDDPRINQMEIDSLIREAANNEFAKRGYRLSTTASAHYKLSYDLAIHTWYAANNTSSLGSLSLWLTDAATRRRVWMGYVRAEILVGLSREERLARMEKALARLLEKFPPSQRGDE